MAHLWPCYRLARVKWATLGEMATVITRPEVLDACDALDALNEAQEDADREAARR